MGCGCLIIRPLNERSPTGPVAQRTRVADDRVGEPVEAARVDCDASPGDLFASRAVNIVDLASARNVIDATGQRAGELHDLIAADAVRSIGAVLPRRPYRAGLAPVEARFVVLASVPSRRVNDAQLAFLVVAAVDYPSRIGNRRVGDTCADRENSDGRGNQQTAPPDRERHLASPSS